VRAAEFRIRSAAGTLRTDELAVLPTIKLNPGVSIAKTFGPFGIADSAWSVGGALAQPVLDRPRLIAQIHAQRAVAEEDVIAYEKAVQTAYGDAETAFIYLQSDGRRVQMLSSAERRAESAYEKARVGYARGINDLTAALQAETTWRNTRTQLTSAQTTLMQRSVQVFKALGGGWAPDQPAAGTPYAGKAAEGATMAPPAPSQGG
jgi:outer membrane protein TolC